MNADGQIYFAPESDIPLEDLQRMQQAELTDAQSLELAKRARQADEKRLVEELQRALGTS